MGSKFSNPVPSLSLVRTNRPLPLAIVIKQELMLWRLRQQAIHDPAAPITVAVVDKEETRQHPVVEAPAAAPPPKEAAASSAVVNSEQPTQPKSRICRILSSLKSPERGEDYTILQALFSIDMIILFVAGGTLTAIDNMGQIGESLGYPARSISTCVSLISIWNFCGRVTAGFVSKIVLTKYRFPRTGAFSVPSLYLVRTNRARFRFPPISLLSLVLLSLRQRCLTEA